MVVCTSHNFPNRRNGCIYVATALGGRDPPHRKIDVRTVAAHYRAEGSLSCRGGIVLFRYSARDR